MARTVRDRNKAVVASLTLQEPTLDQGKRMDAVRKAAQGFAKVVVKNTEDGPEATLAQRHIEQAVFYAIRSVLFNLPESEDPSGGQASVPVMKRRGRPPGSKNRTSEPKVKSGVVKRRRQPA